MLPFDPFFDIDIGSPVGFSIIGVVSGVCVFAAEDDRRGTLGPDPPSAGFSCVPGIAADDEAISSSPPSVLSIGSGGKGLGVENGIGELSVESKADFTLEVESALEISKFGYAYTLVAANDH